MKIFKKITFSILTIIILTLCTSAVMSEAMATEKDYKYMIKVDRAPRVSMIKTNKDFLEIQLKDNYNDGKNAIKSVKLEKYNTQTKKWEEIFTLARDKGSFLETFLEVNKDLSVIKIKSAFFTENENTKIRITVKDNDKYTNTLKATYIIKRVAKKDSKGNYFKVNAAPTITHTYGKVLYKTKKEALKNVIMTLKDNNGLTQLIIKDLNDTNKVKLDKKINNSIEKSYLLDLSKYKEQNGRYRLYVKVVANGNTVREEQIYYKAKILEGVDGIFVFD